MLLANGDHDRMLPTPNTLDMARRLPNNELVIYPDAGHGGIFQFHEQFVENALEFLANQRAENSACSLSVPFDTAKARLNGKSTHKSPMS